MLETLELTGEAGASPRPFRSWTFRWDLDQLWKTVKEMHNDRFTDDEYAAWVELVNTLCTLRFRVSESDRKETEQREEASERNASHVPEWNSTQFSPEIAPPWV